MLEFEIGLFILIWLLREGLVIEFNKFALLDKIAWAPDERIAYNKKFILQLWVFLEDTLCWVDLFDGLSLFIIFFEEIDDIWE